jgi:hypothetical protein
MAWKIFDCAAATPNCTEQNQTVDADPDVAGIGVGKVGWIDTAVR